MTENKENPNDPKNQPEPSQKQVSEVRYVPLEYLQNRPENDDDEIDLLELARTVWENRFLIYKFVALGVVLGVATALLSTKEYKSSAALMPEYSSESAGGGTASRLLQQYGGLLGISAGGTYNSSSNAIRVQLYPQIVSSLSFQHKLASQPFYYAEYDTTASLFDYYIEIQKPGVLSYVKQYTIGLPGLLMGALFSDEGTESETDGILQSGERTIVELSASEHGVIENLRQRVTASLDQESGIITVAVQMTDPQLAAKMADFTIQELTRYLVEYRTEKVLRDLHFVEEQLAAAEERFENEQMELANFMDSNRGTLTSRARTEEQQLQSEYDLAFSLYNGLTQQYEQAKLRVQEETPVFKVLNPVQVPVSDETSGGMILIVFVMLSVIVSIGWIFIRQFLESNPFGREME